MPAQAVSFDQPDLAPAVSGEPSEPVRSPEPPAPGTCVAQAGDSLWTVAERCYDDGRWFRALFEYNRGRLKDDDSSIEGVALLIPARSELATRWSRFCPPDLVIQYSTNRPEPDGETTYVTRPGDTLFDIARQQLGQASRYLEILRLNRNKLPPNTSHLTRLPSGLRLKLPE